MLLRAICGRRPAERNHDQASSAYRSAGRVEVAPSAAVFVFVSSAQQDPLHKATGTASSREVFMSHPAVQDERPLILVVDDEPFLLQVVSRILRGRLRG